MPIPDRRVLVVLGTLVGAMTLASALLLALEPTVASGRVVALQSVDQPQAEAQRLFQTDGPGQPERYSAIVVHDSGTLAGSADTVVGGLGYHFIIGNGRGADDGSIAVSRRWSERLAGAFPAGPGQDATAVGNSIGICLIADTERRRPTEPQIDRLCWLVRQLQTRFDIRGDQVVTPAGDLFPHSRFNRQLLARRLR